MSLFDQVDKTPADFSTEDLLKELGRRPGIQTIIAAPGDAFGIYAGRFTRGDSGKAAGFGPARIFLIIDEGGRGFDSKGIRI
jgi:hypothetical protein